MDGANPTDDVPARRLRIIAADEDPEALRRTADLLEALGHEVTARTASVAEACELIARDDPDAAVVVVHDDEDHALHLIDELSEALSGPVVALLGDAGAAFAEAAAERGLDAIAADLSGDALQAAIEVAMRRHAERTALQEQVGQLEFALERRAVIERAKGALMERHGIDERAAFDRLRAEARRRSVSVVSLAQEVTAAS